jgi:hypothetical protein
MKPRFILVMLGIAALAVLSLGSQAQEKGGGQSKDDIITSDQQLARQFAEFQDALLRLKQRLSRGTPEEKKRAETLDKVLDLCKELAINHEFTRMLEVLRTANPENTYDLTKMHDISDSLATRLRRVREMLENSNTSSISEERKALQEIIKKLEINIGEQKQVRGQTEREKTDQADLKKAQEDASKNTKDIQKAIDRYLDPKGTDTANLKGENKDGGKNKGQQGEAKDAGNEKPAGAKGEAKDAGKDAQGKKGEAKAGQDKAGDPKSGAQDPKADSKAGEKAGGDPKEAGAKGEQKAGQKGQEGAAKESKPGDPKSGKEGKEGSAKDAGAKPGDPKSGDPKDGQQGAAKGSDDKNPGGEKSGPPSQAKPAGEKGSEPKAGPAKEGGAAKGGDAKGGDAKPSPAGAPQAGDSKSGDSKDGQGQAKDGGSPAKGGGDPMGSPPQAGQKGDGGAPPPPGNPKGGDKDDVAQSKKKLDEAGYDQAKAEGDLDKKNNAAAAKNQGDAIKKMEEAKKKLENLLRQMREEEIERVLAALQARCEKMLMMQKQVLAGTEDLDRVVLKNLDKKPTSENKRWGLKLSDQEKEIVQEANKCIDILEAEGSAVAFPEVFQQVRQDMIHVQKRLELTDTSVVTVGIERDIISTLEEMIDALKKARAENQPEPGKPGQPGKAGQPGDQKLLELLQELKMVRSLQKRVNDRTNTYGKLFPNEEQARDAQIVRELRSLSERQQRIQEIVSRIAKGDNK